MESESLTQRRVLIESKSKSAELLPLRGGLEDAIFLSSGAIIIIDFR